MKTFRRSLRLKVKWSEYLRLKIMRERSLRAGPQNNRPAARAPKAIGVALYGTHVYGINLREA